MRMQSSGSAPGVLTEVFSSTFSFSCSPSLPFGLVEIRLLVAEIITVILAKRAPLPSRQSWHQAPRYEMAQGIFKVSDNDLNTS